MNASVPHIRDLGLADYRTVWQRMQAFTSGREASTQDEIWFVQHPPVFTQGVSGQPEHLLAPGDIPVIATDRGGQITYHGPGQWVVYVMLDIRRMGLNVRGLVDRLEDSIITLLADYGITALARPDAPGVYVNEDKIASLGLRVTRGCSYHGMALNVDMDLEPFSRINPCGFAGMQVTQLADHADSVDMNTVRNQLEITLTNVLGFKC